jgi:Fur family transcriptional regulator, ferric uptake regulator
MLNTDKILERLDEQGYRLTGPRRAVLEEVLSRHAPFTSNDLWEAIQQKAPSIGRATVFRTLDLLTQVGVVQRIHRDADTGRCHAYLACDEHHHHHLICNNCGSVTDFTEDKALEPLVREIERRTHFQVEGHRLELTGVCASCRQAGKHRH